LFVIADHNDFLRILAPDFFRPLTFHVVGFFLLNFYGSYTNSRSFSLFIAERSIRYIWPFIIFYSFYAIITFALTDNLKFDLLSYISGLLLGSFSTVKQGCGGAFMWFLPALLGFSLLVKLFAQFNKAGAISFLISSFAFYLLVGGIPQQTLSAFPLGIGVAFYLMPITVSFYVIYSSNFIQLILSKKIGIFVTLSIAASCHMILMASQLNFEIGSLQLPFVDNAFYIIVNFVANIFFSIFLWQCAKYFNIFQQTVGSVGKYSLMIYLIHPLFAAIFSKLFLLLKLSNGTLVLIVLAIGSYFFSLACSWFCAHLLHKSSTLSSFIFPRDISDLKKLLFRIDRL